MYRPTDHFTLPSSSIPALQDALKTAAGQMAGLLPRGVRGVAADALAAVEAERVTLRALEQAAEEWDTMQGTIFIPSDPSSVDLDPDLQRGAAPDAPPPADPCCSLPTREPPLGARHLSAALARVKARTVSLVSCR